ncbi:uncharacterized protein LOC129576469 [Sitodiplosis mosellana]|uniref:uncharacterized protein LOC129576469 n=1 Tax=Sitodiplosis mosellana TaxID=263140 RepID=UPI002445223E|nr:uncharacterized protein LOC129576469 [Sitodiplosis mosellana]
MLKTNISQSTNVRMSDNDADSDTETYFLTPVNEYNIVDKIQSANNLLFASINDKEHDMEIEQQPSEIAIKSDKFLLQSKHRVTFSSDIEEYEDNGSEAESADIQYKDDEAIDKEIAEIIERGERAPSKQSVNTDNDQIDGFMKRLSIEEIVNYSNDEDSVSDDNEYTSEVEVVEEINEAIVAEERENSVTPSPVPIEIVDNANEQTAEIEKRKRAPMLSRNNENDPPCRACNKVTSSSARDYDSALKSNQARCSAKTAAGNRPATSQTKRIASANVRRCSANKHIMNQDDLLKIHLNVRSCCENKYLDNNRLPRYNGYISQYGLSKDQLETRESNRQKYLEKRARREREIMRAKQQIAHLNELAFQQWLIRKNRSSRPKYKNMYDSVEPKPTIKYHPSAKFSRSSESSS